MSLLWITPCPCSIKRHQNQFLIRTAVEDVRVLGATEGVAGVFETWPSGVLVADENFDPNRMQTTLQ